MKVSREESSRIHREMERFYQKFPKYRIQANHQMFLSAAEQDGGSEVLTAEWMELQLDSLRGQLAVLQETPDEALNKFIAENPAYDCEANRQLIAQRVRETHETVQQAVSALQLAFNQEVADEHTAQKEAVEREELARYISKVYSLAPYGQEMEYKKIVGASMEYLRSRATQIRLNSEMRLKSKQELKGVIHHEADRRRAALNPVLPEEITAQAIRSASSAQIYEWNKRFGYKLLNQRLQGRA
jgi:hypothetical protein